ncbi:hypothetical protein [Halodesulfovibrio sp. MK-HDV]|nr:hypothetical protein [Halodesulfovibrio sp. MK-HDV]
MTYKTKRGSVIMTITEPLQGNIRGTFRLSDIIPAVQAQSQRAAK